MRSALAAIFLLAAVTVSGATVEEIVARMDKSAVNFKTAKADVERESYTAVLDDKSVERGKMWMSRSGAKPGDLRLKIELTEPDATSYAVAGNKAEQYFPSIKVVHEYDLGKHRDLVQQYLLFGFGTPGAKLQADYTMKVLGDEQLGSVRATRLELEPKSAETRKQLARVELWISESGIPVRQKFHLFPSKDTLTVTYTNLEINPPLKAADLKLQLPPGVKRERPGR